MMAEANEEVTKGVTSPMITRGCDARLAETQSLSQGRLDVAMLSAGKQESLRAVRHGRDSMSNYGRPPGPLKVSKFAPL